MASDRRKVSWIQRAEFPTKSESCLWRLGDIASENPYTIAVVNIASIQTKLGGWSCLRRPRFVMYADSSTERDGASK